jgi:hypothetical protein
MPIPLILPADFLTPPADIGDVARLADDGRDLMFDAARAQRVFEAARDRRLEPDQSRGIVLRLIADAKGLVRAATESLVAGSIRLGAWFHSLKSTLLPRHFAAAAALLNHPDLPPADMEAVANLSRGQVGYLERFRSQLATAAQLLDGTAVARAGMYADAVWGVGQKVLRAKMTRDGYRFERNILGYADHCSQCLSETSMGLVAVGTLSAPGDRICHVSCRCYLEFE